MKIPQSTPPNKTGIATPDRLKTLADGVFAIVMTILVLELSVPIISEASADGGLAHGLTEMWPEFLIYGLSFLVLGIFWLIHHMIFDAIAYYDSTLSWLNIIFLMFVALIPFSTALFGEYGAVQITATVYGINMLLIFNMGWAMWSYVTRKPQLIVDDLDPDIVKGGKKMGLVYTLILVPAIGISFVSPVTSFVIYSLMVVGFIVLTMLGRSDIATVWPETSKPRGE
jgi:uncharacterized membrane protein